MRQLKLISVQRAKNLAGMSGYARERWLFRWAEKRGYKTIPSR